LVKAASVSSFNQALSSCKPGLTHRERSADALMPDFGKEKLAVGLVSPPSPQAVAGNGSCVLGAFWLDIEIKTQLSFP